MVKLTVGRRHPTSLATVRSDKETVTSEPTTCTMEVIGVGEVLNGQGGQDPQSHQIGQRQDQHAVVQNQRQRRSNWTPELERRERESKQALNVFVCGFVVVLLCIVIVTIPEFGEA